MTRVGAIDCGTNSIRLLVADIDLPEGSVPVLTDVVREMEVVRLGYGVDRTGRIDPAAMERTLVAATRHGAAICGVGDELGTVEVGKIADLIVVGANPLENINNVRRLQLVMKDGRIVSDKRR